MSGIEFGKTKEGNTVTKYLLKNKNGMEVAVMDRIRACAGSGRCEP